MPAKAQPITSLSTSEEIRFPTGMGELDRVLGGGAVRGSLVLVSGAPGIGKSDIVQQFADSLGMECVSLLGSQLAPEDIIGIPAEGCPAVSAKTGCRQKSVMHQTDGSV